MTQRLLTPVQSIETSGARAVETFSIDGTRYLAIPQLARDIPGQPAHMNGGDSDIDALLYRWQGEAWIADGTLPLAGGEDIEYFEIGGRRFLATAGIRTGKGPYDLDCEAVIYEWTDASWNAIQHVPVFAAKQWRAFEIDGRYFLALAQGVTVDGVMPKHARTSCIFEWDGERFTLFQNFDGQWGYDWIHAAFAGSHYLAYSDHIDGAVIYRWNGERFEVFQTIPEKGSRTFRFFESDGAWWMVFVNLLSHTTLYRFDGQQFVATQSLSDAGGRALCLFDGIDVRYLLLARFVTGSPQAPIIETHSQLFEWKDAAFELVETVATSAATDATTFVESGQRYVMVSNSLNTDIRFGVQSVLFRFDG